MGFVPGEIMKKEFMAIGSSLYRFHDVQTWLQDNRGWVLSLENYEEGIHGDKVVIKQISRCANRAPGYLVIEDGFCPWRNYEEGVQGKGHFNDG